MQQERERPTPRSARERKAAFDQKMSNRGGLNPDVPERWPCTVYLTAEAKDSLNRMREERQLLGCATETNSALVEQLILGHPLGVKPAELKVPPSIHAELNKLRQNMEEAIEGFIADFERCTAHASAWVGDPRNMHLIDPLIHAARTAQSATTARYEMRFALEDLLFSFSEAVMKESLPKPLSPRAETWIRTLFLSYLHQRKQTTDDLI